MALSCSSKSPLLFPSKKEEQYGSSQSFLTEGEASPKVLEMIKKSDLIFVAFGQLFEVYIKTNQHLRARKSKACDYGAMSSIKFFKTQLLMIVFVFSISKICFSHHEMSLVGLS